MQPARDDPGTLQEVFPQIPVAPSQVVYTYCGVRPLPRSDSNDLRGLPAGTYLVRCGELSQRLVVE